MSGVHFIVIPLASAETAQRVLDEEFGEGLGYAGVVLADLDVPGLDDAYAQAARERDEREAT